MTIFIGKSFTDYGVMVFFPNLVRRGLFTYTGYYKKEKIQRVEQIFTLHDPCSERLIPRMN